MPFTNIREWSGPPVDIREWRRFAGSTERPPYQDDYWSVAMATPRVNGGD